MGHRPYIPALSGRLELDRFGRRSMPARAKLNLIGEGSLKPRLPTARCPGGAGRSGEVLAEAALRTAGKGPQ